MKLSVQMFTDPAEMTRSRLLLRYIAAAERAYKSAVTEFECSEGPSQSRTGAGLDATASPNR